MVVISGCATTVIHSKNAKTKDPSFHKRLCVKKRMTDVFIIICFYHYASAFSAQRDSTPVWAWTEVRIAGRYAAESFLAPGPRSRRVQYRYEKPWQFVRFLRTLRLPGHRFPR